MWWHMSLILHWEVNRRISEFNVSLLYVVRSFSKEARTFPNGWETIINSLTDTDVRVT